jgi:hypothetical protein
MTQTKWDSLSPAQRDSLRDNSGLTPVLRGMEGWRVEVVDSVGDKPRRFIVGKSTGWRPCHLEISRRTAFGGHPARKDYAQVRGIERVR